MIISGSENFLMNFTHIVSLAGGVSTLTPYFCLFVATCSSVSPNNL